MPIFMTSHAIRALSIKSGISNVAAQVPMAILSLYHSPAPALVAPAAALQQVRVCLVVPVTGFRPRALKPKTVKTRRRLLLQGGDLLCGFGRKALNRKTVKTRRPRLLQGGDLLAQYEGHKHESYKLDCCLTPSDAFVICGSEDGASCPGSAPSPAPTARLS